ncbi:MAG TPA: cytochrome c [Bacillales bacterium]|nr:cytochrome c [Bacillales bacterium]
MKRGLLFSLILALVLGLSACGGGDGESGKTGSSGSGEGESSAGQVDSNQAREIFQQNCASCHGANLEGGMGPALKNIGSQLSEKEILAQIKNGGGAMPGGLIEGDDAKLVASWLAGHK